MGSGGSIRWSQSLVLANSDVNCLHPSRGMDMDNKLEGKSAVIIGATSGMALATAKLFVEEGAYVFITGRRLEQLDAAVMEIGKNVTGVQGDAEISPISTGYMTRSRRRRVISTFCTPAPVSA